MLSDTPKQIPFVVDSVRRFESRLGSEGFLESKKEIYELRQE